MDDVSLSYYDNELQDDDDHDPECIESLSEQRSEIGCTPTSDHMSDIEANTGKYSEKFENFKLSNLTLEEEGFQHRLRL